MRWWYFSICRRNPPFEFSADTKAFRLGPIAFHWFVGRVYPIKDTLNG